MTRNVVDFPHPEGPSKHITCPAATDKDMPRTTSVPSKTQERLLTSSRGEFWRGTWFIGRLHPDKNTQLGQLSGTSPPFKRRFAAASQMVMAF
jgi:hypothetical protein